MWSNCESDQALKKQSAVETPRPPLFPAEKSNGTTRRFRTREISSRYSSPSTSASSDPKRCPSPNITRTGATSSVPAPAPKRAISAERRRPSTPPSPPSPSTPVHELASRKEITGSRLPEALWPSRMRSLTVSFQSDTFSLPISKREKPVTTALSDRTLKSSSNVTHIQAETQLVSRKSTPVRKRSPLKGNNASDQSENSKPVDGLQHVRRIDQHRWPSRTGGKVSSNALAKSLSLTDKTTKASTTQHTGTVVLSLGRMSIPDRMSRPFVDYNLLRIPKPVSSSSSERMTLPTPAVRSQSLPTPGSRPPSPNKASLLSSSVSRGVSPSQTRVLNCAPARGVSPSRIRPGSPTRQSNSSTSSVLSFVADIRKGKKGANHIEDAHQLRLLYNSHLQWRYANAREDAVLYSQKVTAENLLCNVWRTTSELWDSITEMRIDLQQRRMRLKLYSVLNQQMAYLNEWALIDRDHTCALFGAIEDLQASTLHLPVTGGPRANIEFVKTAVCSAVDVMQTMGSSISSVLSRVEGMNCLVSELADVAAREKAMLDECEYLLASTAAMQVEEYSLRTHLIQSKQVWKSG